MKKPRLKDENQEGLNFKNKTRVDFLKDEK